MEEAAPESGRFAANRPPTGVASAGDAVVYSQDLKCMHCGWISGRFVGPTSVPTQNRAFQPASGQEVPSDFQPARPRCFRCGGSCYLDEVESTIRLRPEELEKPRRGRKPKVRPAP